MTWVTGETRQCDEERKGGARCDYGAHRASMRPIRTMILLLMSSPDLELVLRSPLKASARPGTGLARG